MDNPVVENDCAFEVLPAETDDGTPVTTKSPSVSAAQFSIIFNLTARVPLMASLHRLWTNYYPRVGEECVVIPVSTLKFVIYGLLSFAEIRSQDKTGFPFQTHPRVVIVSITSLLMYGLASAAENVVSAARTDDDHTCVYAVIARLGRMIALYMLVASLATLFYF